jgi:1-acyl-sn-glycerol-3-phosphate acyltransferase
MAVVVVPRAQKLDPAVLADGLLALAQKAGIRARPSDLDARDATFIDRVLPLFGALYDHYVRCETEVVEHPPRGPFLAVANHNGMTGTPDMFCHMVAFWRLHGSSRAAYGLMHDMPFRLPVAGAWLNAVGALAAHPDNARRALERGAALLVFPGGDLDACKPFRERYRIDFGRRRGFVRAALRAGVPIVPIVSVGAHHSLYLYSDGRRIAEALGLPRLARSNVAPIGFALPFGLVAGIPYPHVPLPVKVHTRILAPIHLGLPPAAADEPATVEEVYRTVIGVMQSAMNELRDAGRHGLFPRR